MNLFFSPFGINFIEGNTLIGELKIDIHPNNIAHFRSIYLLEEYRNQRILKNNFPHILNYLRKKSIKKITLISPYPHIFTKLGFKYNENDFYEFNLI